MSIRLRPVRDSIVVIPDKDENRDGFVVIEQRPDREARRSRFGTVESVGPGVPVAEVAAAMIASFGDEYDEGYDTGLAVLASQDMPVEPGDRILFHSYAAEPIRVGDREVLIIQPGDVLAVLEYEPEQPDDD